MRQFLMGTNMSLAKRVRFCLFLIICAVMIGDALAGAEPTELDQFSSYQQLSIQGHDVVLQGNIRMPNGNWDSLLNSELNNKEIQKQRPSSPLSCSVPLQTLKDYSLNKNGVATGSPPDAGTLYCDTDKIWFASTAYCGEGDDNNNESGQAYLHSFDIHTGKVTTYQNFIPRCESISSLVRIGNEMWATTYFQGEYEKGGRERRAGTGPFNRSCQGNSTRCQNTSIHWLISQLYRLPGGVRVRLDLYFRRD